MKTPCPPSFSKLLRATAPTSRLHSPPPTPDLGNPCPPLHLTGTQEVTLSLQIQGPLPRTQLTALILPLGQPLTSFTQTLCPTGVLVGVQPRQSPGPGLGAGSSCGRRPRRQKGDDGGKERAHVLGHLGLTPPAPLRATCRMCPRVTSAKDKSWGMSCAPTVTSPGQEDGEPLRVLAGGTHLRAREASTPQPRSVMDQGMTRGTPGCPLALASLTAHPPWPSSCPATRLFTCFQGL